jgi:hypothetical protein
VPFSLSLSLFFVTFFCGVSVRFSTRGVQKHHPKNGGNPCQKLFAKKVEGGGGRGGFFPVIFPFDFLIAFFGRWPFL